jgi:hypothetical protein
MTAAVLKPAAAAAASTAAAAHMLIGQPAQLVMAGSQLIAVSTAAGQQQQLIAVNTAAGQQQQQLIAVSTAAGQQQLIAVSTVAGQQQQQLSLGKAPQLKQLLMGPTAVYGTVSSSSSSNMVAKVAETGSTIRIDRDSEGDCIQFWSYKNQCCESALFVIKSY